MQVSAQYLIKLATLAKGLSSLNQGISNTQDALSTLKFDEYISQIRENPDKFVEKWWGKEAKQDPEKKELVSDLHDLLLPFRTREEQTTALQTMALAATQKAAEMLIPQGIGLALQIPYSIH
jgi:hypothetical protein